MATRRHILTPYQVDGHIIRYSVRLRQWVVDELHYFKTKEEALASIKKEKNPEGRGKVSNPTFADEAGEWEVSYMKDGIFIQKVVTFKDFKHASKWAKGQAKKYGDVTVYRETPSRVYMATWDSHGNRKNPSKKRNPGESADAIAKGFHGRVVKERFEVEEEELYPDNLAVLGCLVELSIISGSGTIPIRGFKNPYSPGYRKGDEVYLAAADRNNLEMVGGDQEIVNAEKIAGFTNKRLVRLGKVKSIVYLADKHHLVGSNGKEEEFEHDFGRKKYFLFGKQTGQPDLMYDTLNKTMSLVGGSYTITDEGIKN